MELQYSYNELQNYGITLYSSTQIFDGVDGVSSLIKVGIRYGGDDYYIPVSANLDHEFASKIKLKWGDVDYVLLTKLGDPAILSNVVTSNPNVNSVTLSSTIEENDSTVIEKGFVVNKIGNPTINDTKYIVNEETFSAEIDMDNNENYYVRSYVNNISSGISYSEERTIKKVAVYGWGDLSAWYYAGDHYWVQTYFYYMDWNGSRLVLSKAQFNLTGSTGLQWGNYLYFRGTKVTDYKYKIARKAWELLRYSIQ